MVGNNYWHYVVRFRSSRRDRQRITRPVGSAERQVKHQVFEFSGLGALHYQGQFLNGLPDRQRIGNGDNPWHRLACLIRA